MGSIAGDDVGGVAAGGKVERILVSVRVRPLNGKELERHDTSDWECINANTIIFKNSLPERSMFPTAYMFDRVFGCATTTKQVYEDGAKEVVLSVVSGINSSIFAYGQTSSGKTYTMTGITGYGVSDIYEYIQEHPEREFVLKFSAMEIYNEAVRDLLSPDSAPLRLLDDPEKGTIVEKLTEETLTDQDHLMELLSFCAAQRQIGETSLNEMSSRSHQILRLTIESSARHYLGMGKSSTLAATVNFVDLAGSERASQALSAGTRLKEGCHINRSLLTLGTVIRKLSKGRNGHIPYRDSKLTRILQSSLGGNAKTAIICTMSPARSHIEQSRNTLLFATCAKEVATNAQVNVVMSDKALVKHLQRELARLENEMRYTVPTSTNSSDALKEKDAQIKKMDKEMKELMQQRDLAQSRLEDLLRALGDDQGSRQWEELSPSSIPHIISCEDTFSISETSGSPVFGNTKYCSSPETKDCAKSPIHIFGKRKERHASSPLCLSASTPSFMGQEVSHFKCNDFKDQCKEVRCIEVDEPSMNITDECNLLLTEESDSLLPPSIDAQEPAGPKPKPKEERSLMLKPSQLPLPLPKVSSSHRGLKLTRSRSCRATMTTTSSPWCHEEENMNTPPNNFLRDSPGRSEGTRKKQLSINYGAELERHSQDAELRAHSRDGSISQTSEQSISDDVIEPQTIKTCKLSINYGAELEKHSQDAELGTHSQDGSISQTSEQSISDDVLKPQNINTFQLSMNYGVELEKHSQDTDLGTHSRDGSISQTSEQSISDDVLKPHNIKTCQLSMNYGAELEKHSQDTELGTHSGDGSISKASEQSTSADVLKPQNIKTCPDNDVTIISNTVEGLKEMVQIQYHKQLTDGQETENPSNYDSGVKITVKEVCLEPVLKSSESPSRWPLEFDRKQREIVELWHACNVSLIHRSYFFLLIKGDPTDSFYIEVEYRRLSFLRHSLSEGSVYKTTAEDGQSDGLALRTLRREREKICRGLSRLPAAERERLYTKWDIALDSKQRRLQLSRRVWTETNDMEHARESAMLVAKVLRFLEPAQAPKEMFGLSFSPQLTSRRSFGWRNSMSSFR